jgi:hypothetical protein
MKFRWEGFDKSGTVKRGYVDAESDGAAHEKLRQEMGIMVQKCEPDGPVQMKTVLPGGESLGGNPEAFQVASRALGPPLSAGSIGGWKESLTAEITAAQTVMRYCADAKLTEGFSDAFLAQIAGRLIGDAMAKAVSKAQS